MSKLIMQDKTLLIITSLAMRIGLNEAIFIQQVHYWLSKSQHFIEGKSWVYNTYEEWRQQMPFWSVSTIKRIIRSLEQNGLLVSGKFNHSKMDQTKWYTINYEAMAVPDLDHQDDTMDCPMDQEEDLSGSERATLESSLTKAIPEITTEITTKITTEKNKDILSDFNDFLNQIPNRANSRNTTTLPQERVKDG
jgi:hypothetical protein